MSFFEDASLVMIPSGYKASKVYSVKPTDGTGDLTFTRSNDTATRVGPDGLIEKVRTNLLLQSNTFTNATWDKLGVSVTAGQAGYDGTNNATLITVTSAFPRLQQTITGTGLQTLSLYAKAGAYDFLLINALLNGGGDNAVFNIVTGTLVGGFITQVSSSITPVGGGWFEISVTFNATLGSLAFGTTIDGTVASWATATAGSIFVQNAMLQTGDIATDYIATTSAAVSVGPVANVPRLDYLNSSCPRLLLEPQRTNELTFSEQLNNAVWTNVENVSVSANVATAPDGTMSADKLVENTATDQHRIYRSFGGSGATFSFFAKAAGRNFVAVLSNNGSFTYFNIANGTLGTIAATSTATITDYGNGWYRCSVFNTHPSFGALIQLATANNVTSYLGDGTSGAFIWGCQFESSATYATSYIPTLGAAVTRGADAASKTGISSLIGQTEGTIYGEMYTNPSGTESLLTWLRNSTAGLYSNFIFVGTNGSAQPRVQVVQSGTQQAEIIGSALAVGLHKFAFAYKLNDFAFYVDGVQIGTASSGTIPTGMNELFIDQYIDGGIRNASKNQTLLFKTRLTNDQLAELTA